MTTKLDVGDTGTVIVLDCGQDISAASARSIEVRKPDRTTASWSASASGTNSVSYTTVAGTLNLAGVWLLQAKITLPSGVWLGQTVSVEVAEAFA